MTGAKYASRGLPRCGFAAIALVLSIAPTVAAQSITDARRVEFTPSPDHDAVDPNGIALVNNYTLDVFLAGGTSVVQTANLGKPAPDADGMIRVDFVSLLPNPLTPGVIYETVVSAVGPGGSTPSARSNTFGFSLPCPPTITPTSQSLRHGWNGDGNGQRRIGMRVDGGQQRHLDHGNDWSDGTWIWHRHAERRGEPGTTSRTGTVTICEQHLHGDSSRNAVLVHALADESDLCSSRRHRHGDRDDGRELHLVASSGSSWVTITNGSGRARVRGV